MDDLSRWLPHSPFRVPEWRWLRAMHMHETGRRIDHRIDDEWVSLARDALRVRGRTNSPAATVQAARDVWVGEPNRRGEMEARLLAGDEDVVIAACTALPERVVAAYAAVFFDVRPAVAAGASDWLLFEAVGYSPLIGFTRPLPWAGWKLAAVAGGSLFADLVIAATTGRPLPAALRDPGGAEEVRVREQVRLWVASMAAVTPAAFAGVLREYRRFRMFEARLRGRRVSVDPAVMEMESFLLSRSASAMRSDSLANGVHHVREDVGDVSEQAGGTTPRRGGELIGSGHQARPPKSPPSRPSARRTHAA